MQWRGPVGGQKLAILLVDDDTRILDAWRYQRYLATILTAATGQQALDIVATQSLDGIVVDFRLDDEDGIDLIRQIRWRAPRTKVLGVSAHVSIDAAIRAIQAGADDVKTKPVLLRSVLHWINTGTWQGGSTSDTASLDLAIWEYVQRIYAECGENLSETARRLGIQRYTVRSYLHRPRPQR